MLIFELIFLLILLLLLLSYLFLLYLFPNFIPPPIPSSLSPALVYLIEELSLEENKCNKLHVISVRK
jgi:hypothetical protein